MSEPIYKTGSDQAVQVTTLIPLDVREMLRMEARKADMGLNEYLRALVFNALGLEAPKVAHAKKACAKKIVAATERIDKQGVHPALKWQPESVIDLAARGFSGQQIAARLRMPYRAVMAELGRDIDQAVDRHKLQLIHNQDLADCRDKQAVRSNR